MHVYLDTMCVHIGVYDAMVCLCLCLCMYMCVFVFLFRASAKQQYKRIRDVYSIGYIVKMESAKTCAPILHMNNFYYLCLSSRCLIHSSALSFAQAIPFDAVCGSVLFFVFRFPVQQTFYRVAIYTQHRVCVNGCVVSAILYVDCSYSRTTNGPTE